MSVLFRRSWQMFVLLACGVLLGCGQTDQGPQTKPPPPEVKFRYPVQRSVTDYDDFSGKTDALRTIEIRSRVTGYLDKVCFEEGAEVKRGATLFVIDPRPYQAELERTEANVFQGEAHLSRLTSDYQRAVTLRNKGAIGQEEFDKVQGDRMEAEASAKAARANRNIAKLNLEFTNVTAPIDGRMSRQFMDPGNLVKADDTMLTTLVSQDSIYAYFDVDERTHLRLKRLAMSSPNKSPRDVSLPVQMGLVDESGFPHEGQINFEDNRLEASTGTFRLRAIFPNKDRLLTPGLFVRIRLPIGTPRDVLLIPEQAIGADQGLKFVYVIGDENRPVYRRVKVGRQHDGLRVVTEGLAKGDKIMVSGLQRVQPDFSPPEAGKPKELRYMPVTPKEEDSPAEAPKAEAPKAEAPKDAANNDGAKPK